ncbi:MAG: hypothetical protein ACYCZD_12715 [Rhodanobacter sp.]
MTLKISQLTPIAAGTLDGTEPVELGIAGDKSAPNGAFLPPGYIDGLQMQWVSATAVTVSHGAAYVPSLGRVMRVPNAIALTGLTLTASTFYHLYLYDNVGTPSVECVTTAPDASYNGTARAKTGDTSRRYIGSVLTDAGGNIYSFRHSNNVVAYREAISYAPFTVASGFAATVPTNVSCAGCVPPTGFRAQIHYDNNSQQQLVFGNSECNFTLASSFFLHLTSALPVGFTERILLELPLDSSQQFQTMYVAAPGSTAAFRVLSYTYER